jgi:hypothetical protein
MPKSRRRKPKQTTPAWEYTTVTIAGDPAALAAFLRANADSVVMPEEERLRFIAELEAGPPNLTGSLVNYFRRG